MNTKDTKLFVQRALVLLVFLAVAAISSKIIAAAGAQDRRASVWAGVYSDAQADRGRALYDGHCRMCHGRYLEGAPAVPSESPTSGRPPLIGWEFRGNWNQMTLGDLLERIRISMPQNAIGSLTRQQVADILAYVLRENGYPPGIDEMPPDKAQLDTIWIEGW